MESLPTAIVTECKAKLLNTKAELLNQLRDHRAELSQREFSGDEGDLSRQALEESRLLIKNQRLRHQLLEVDLALARIEQGRFGICEETLQPIEANRLLAIPWTRLSIEGAEIRDETTKRHSS